MAELTIHQSGEHFTIRCDGWELASSSGRFSETQTAILACARFAQAHSPRVLIGGLGMGFSLRGALDVLPPDAEVLVAELFPQVIEWNEQTLGHLAGWPLRDPRVRLVVADVAWAIDVYGPFQAIVLDVDNGPRTLTVPTNRQLYRHAGLTRIRQSLDPRGILAVWSPGPDRNFVRRLRRAGFSVQGRFVPAAETETRVRHVVYLACPATDR